MKTITKKQFLADVMHEIEMLKKYATEEEKAKLDFSTLNPIHEQRCIYGQLTNDCTSNRAAQLMNLSCIRQMDGGDAETFQGKTFTNIAKNVNGEYDKRTWQSWGRKYSYMSVLEAYINLKSAKNADIISYIKGDLKTLSL